MEPRSLGSSQPSQQRCGEEPGADRVERWTPDLVRGHGPRGHRGAPSPARAAPADPARAAGGLRLHRPGGRAARRAPRSTCRAPTCTGSSPSTATSVPTPPGDDQGRGLPGRGLPGHRGGRARVHAQRRLGVAFGATTADGSVTLDQVFCLGNCALSPAVHRRRQGLRPGRRRAVRRPGVRCARTSDSGAAHERTSPSSSRATPRRGRSAPTRWPSAIAAEAAARGLDVARRAQRVARHALARAARRGRDADGGRVGLRPGHRRRRRRPARRRPARRRRARARPRGHRRDRLARPPAAPHLRARRRRSTRSRPRRLRGARRPGRAARGAGHAPAGRRRGRRRRRACAVAAAPASPPGIKWRTVADGGRRQQKFVCCNADEGDSGTFADRMLMEGDPFTLIEGMTIAGLRRRRDAGLRLHPLGVPRRRRHLRRAIEVARERGLARRRRPRQRPCRSTSRCAWAPAPTSAARRPRCSTASRASAAWCAPSRRCPRSRDCSARRPSSTTCSPWRPCRWSSPRAPTAYARARRRAVARHAGVPARRQHRARRHRRDGVRAHAARARRGLRRRHAARAVRCARCRWAGRSAPTSRPTGSTCRSTTRRSPRPVRCSATAAIVVFDDTVDMAAPGAVRDGVLRRGVVRQVHAVPRRVPCAASR